jgi:putative effector of murein hydrolase LrgA (UPF0299 family)
MVQLSVHFPRPPALVLLLLLLCCKLVSLSRLSRTPRFDRLSPSHNITKQQFNTFNIMAKSSIILALFCAFLSLYNVVAGTNAEGEKV